MKRNRIDLKHYRTATFMRWAIYFFDLRSPYGTTMTKRGPCPVCCVNKPNARFLAVDIPKGVFYCHSCKWNGDAITMYSKLAGVTCWQAAVDLSAMNKTPVPWLESVGQTLTKPTDEDKSKTPGLALGNNQSSPCESMPQAEFATAYEIEMHGNPSRN